MNSKKTRFPLLDRLYRGYLTEEDSAAFIKAVSRHYTTASLERLAREGSHISRRAAVLALGFLGGYESNMVMGRALSDRDRGVRLLADSGIRSVWCRAGNTVERQELSIIIRRNLSRQFEEATQRATLLIERAPWFAEAWNQRAIAYFNLQRFDESLLDCRQALELNPYHFGAAAGMGQCHLQSGNIMAAIDSFSRAINLNPSLEGVRSHMTVLQRTLDERS